MSKYGYLDVFQRVPLEFEITNADCIFTFVLISIPTKSYISAKIETVKLLYAVVLLSILTGGTLFSRVQTRLLCKHFICLSS